MLPALEERSCDSSRRLRLLLAFEFRSGTLLVGGFMPETDRPAFDGALDVARRFSLSDVPLGDSLGAGECS